MPRLPFDYITYNLKTNNWSKEMGTERIRILQEIYDEIFPLQHPEPGTIMDDDELSGFIDGVNVALSVISDRLVELKSEIEKDDTGVFFDDIDL